MAIISCMKNTKHRIYVTDKFLELKSMHRSNNAMAKRFGVYAVTMSNAIGGKPVQASFVANVLKHTGIEFEKLFRVE